MLHVKEFNSWNTLKQSLEKRRFDSRSTFRERDVWWCSLGVNIGTEEDGKNKLFERPVLVVKKFNNQAAWIVPLSSKIKLGKYYFQLDNKAVLLSQLRFISIKRLNRFIRRISTYEYSMIKGRISELIYFD